MNELDDLLQELPEDLREWIRPESLLRYALDAVQSVVDQTPVGEEWLPAGLPRTWLTVLTYAYAIGLGSAEDIELESRRDPQLAYAAASDGLSPSALRHFRRSHRHCLRHALALVLSRVWHLRNSSGFEDDRLEDEVFERAAEERINAAVLADTMVLDA